MVNSSPVPPHRLQVQSLIGEMTTSSLRVLATTRNYRANDGRSIGPVRATSRKAVATAGDEKGQPALGPSPGDRSADAPERLLLDAIAAGISTSTSSRSRTPSMPAACCCTPFAQRMRSPSSVSAIRSGSTAKSDPATYTASTASSSTSTTTPSQSAYCVPSDAFAAASSAAHHSRSTSSTGPPASRQPEPAPIASDQADRECPFSINPEGFAE
jgi:hypothetical protein